MKNKEKLCHLGLFRLSLRYAKSLNWLYKCKKMDEKTKKTINEMIKQEVNSSLTKKSPLFSKAFLRKNLIGIVSTFIAFAALFVSYQSYKLSYKKNNPRKYYKIEWNINKNLDSFEDYLVRYFNDRTFKNLSFDLYMKIKNTESGITPRLDTISGSLEIDIWGIAKNNRNKYSFKKISTIDDHLPEIPITFVDKDGNSLERPLVEDMLDGHFKYNEEKAKDNVLALLRIRDSFKVKKDLGDLTISMRYVGNYPMDYKPSIKDVSPDILVNSHRFSRFKSNKKSSLTTSEREHLLLKHIVHIVFKGTFIITDHFGNKCELPLVLVYEAFLGDPYLEMQLDYAKDCAGKGNTKEASEIIDELLGKNPYYEAAHYLHGQLLLKQNKTSLAMQAFEKSYGLNDAELLLANHFFENNELSKSVLCLKSHLSKKAQPIADLNEMQIKKLLESLKNSMQNKKMGEKEKKDLAAAYCAFGVWLKNNHKMEDALNYLEVSISLISTLIDVHYEMAMVYFELEQYEEAIEIFKICLELSEKPELDIVTGWSSADRYCVFSKLGLSYLQVKQHSKALDIFYLLANIKTSDPFDYVPRYLGFRGLSKVYKDKKNYEKTFEFLRKAKEVAKKNDFDVTIIESIQNEIKEIQKELDKEKLKNVEVRN
jgi:tetratricopeptide (TPR) repeat protein